MLRENPQHRPNIYQVVAEVCSMRHRPIPIKDVCLTLWLYCPMLRLARSTLAEHSQKRDGTSSFRLPSPKALRRLLLSVYKELHLPCRFSKYQTLRP